MGGATGGQDERYLQAVAGLGQALQRLAHAYEADTDLRGDLLQDIHIALWRSFGAYDERCSVRTWVYRVAHNVGASHVIRRRRAKAAKLVTPRPTRVVVMLGTRVAETILASSPCDRTQRPDIWKQAI